MVASDIAFANAFDAKFQALTKGLSHYEIPLFRALQSALLGLPGNFRVEEYHGNSHQVRFAGDGIHARFNARCELSDLLIITYSSITRNARLTYLQAKSERAVLKYGCGARFSANLEQWFLLSKRPKISGVASFDPPSDLLSHALLPSVGSFAFFYKDVEGNFQTFYAAADYMSPPVTYTQRYGSLQSIGGCGVTNTAGHAECLSACGNVAFAASLYRLEIGTPIHGAITESAATRNWLASHLRKIVASDNSKDRQVTLAKELLEIMEPVESSDYFGSFGAKSLIIIKSDVEPIHSSNANLE